MTDTTDRADPSRTFALLRAYLRGEAPLAPLVEGLRALPASPDGSPWFGIDDRELEGLGVSTRLAALGAALEAGDAGSAPGGT